MLPWIRKNIFSKRTVASAIFAAAAVFVFLSWPDAPLKAQEDTFGVQPVAKVIQLGSDDLRVVIARIIRAALGLLGVIAVGIILYAGVIIMTSGGNEEKVATGRRILINATIGLAIILSAFGIVQFVLKNLQDAILGPQGEEEGLGPGGKPAFSTFAGSGALGSIIKFHYPTPNQTDVPRNTKIAVTFAEPVAPGSFIKNTNGTCWPSDGGVKPVAISKDACLTFTEGAAVGEPVPYYGDCLDLNGDQGISWETECDRVATSTVQIYQTQFATSTPKPVYEAAALAVYEADKTSATFTFRPLTLLGDSVADVWHTVRLLGGTGKTAGIKRPDGSDIFPSNKLTKHYEWQFETNTTVDFTPPHVSDTYPSSGGAVPRNSIIQVTFSEPMDPGTAQGSVGSAGSGANLVFSGAAISGEWKITNGYKTAEFVSSQACGQNSCGETMYCLPVECAVGDEKCETKYTGLARTAALLDPAAKNFAAVPFTGLTDMAGNALDNGPGGVADGVLAKPHKPAIAVPAVAGAGELAPDNFFWNFSVANTIDRTAPYLSKVTPGIDAEGVKGVSPAALEFSRPMWQSTIVSGVKLEEYPAGVQGLDSLPFYHDFGVDSEGQTVVNVKPGRPFGPNGLDLYYFASVSSSVKSTNFNCLYPGRGPTGVKGSSPTCVYEEDKNGGPVKDVNCVVVKFEPAADTGCVTATALNQTEADVAACVEKIKSVSPTAPK